MVRPFKLSNFDSWLRIKHFGSSANQQAARYFCLNSQGFTLVELLTVTVIMGLLSAIAIPSFLNQANKARQSEAQTYVSAINRAQQTFFLERNKFGGLSELELGLSNSRNYVYNSVPSGSGTASAALTTAMPTSTAKGYAGKVWIMATLDGTATTQSVVCEGPSASVPVISGTVCP